MQLGLAIAVALLIVAVVAWPLAMRRRNHPDATPAPAEAAPDPDRRAALESVYDAIRTLQTDYRLGRVNDDDYQSQLDEYRHQAARLLRALDTEKGDQGHPSTGSGSG